MCTITHELISILDENWLSSKCCKFVKNNFWGIILLHAHLQYVCNIPAKYQMNIPKALGGVDFTKYTLLPISHICTVVENWLSSKCCKFVKNIFFC